MCGLCGGSSSGTRSVGECVIKQLDTHLNIIGSTSIIDLFVSPLIRAFFIKNENGICFHYTSEEKGSQFVLNICLCVPS